MSPNAPAFKAVPQDSDLLSFIQANEAVKDMLTKLNVSPEQAMKMTKLRLKLVEVYMKIMGEQEASRKAEEEAAEATRLAEAEDALLDAIDTDILGLTPEQKQQQVIEAWVLAFGKGEAKDLPVPSTDKTGKVYFCAAPVKCCNKKKPVHAGAFWNDQLYGICSKIVVAFRDIGQKIGRPDHLFYMNINRAAQELEARNKSKLVSNWVEAFAYNSADELPEYRTDANDDVLCGLHGPCCDRKHPAVRFAVYQGVIYGLCQYAADVYRDCFNRNGSTIMYLKTAGSYSALESIAAQQQREKGLFDLVEAIAGGTLQEPLTMQYSDDEQFPVCALHQYGHCCDGTQEQNKYASHMGVVYAICQKVAGAFIAGLERHGDLACLKFTKDFKQAEYFAEQWRLANPAPVSDKGSAGAKSRKVDLKKARRERDQATRSEMKGQKRNDDSNIKKGKKQK